MTAITANAGCSLMDFETQRIALRKAICAMERQQGAALLDDNPFDARPLIDAREGLAALDAAEGEQERRRIEALVVARDRDRSVALDEARDAIARYESAVAQVEAHSKALAASVADLVQQSRDLGRLSRRLGIRAWGPLNADDASTRLSRLIAGEFDAVGLARFGDLDWPSVPRPEWGEQLIKIIEPLLQLKEDYNDHARHQG